MENEYIGIKNALRTSAYAFRIWKNKKLFNDKNRFFRANHYFWLAYERGFRHSIDVLLNQFHHKRKIMNNGFPFYKNFDTLLEDIIKHGGVVLNKSRVTTDKYALLISHELTLTGAPIALLHMANALRELGITPVILSPFDGPLAKEAKYFDITAILYKDVYKNDYIVSIASFFDFVVVNTLACSGVIHKFNYTNIPVMWWIHEAKESYVYIGNDIPASVAPNIKVYACGEYSLKLLKRYRPNYNAKEFLYYIPIHHQQSDNISSNIIKKIRNKKSFLCVGTLCERKGQSLLIDSIQHLKINILKKSVFIFVGENFSPSIYNELLKLIKKYPNNIIYINRLRTSQMPILYEKIDALICPSTDDPMPMVVAEALSFNKLVICSSNTGSAGLINRHKSGVVFKSNDKKQLIRCIENAFNGLYNDFLSSNNAVLTYNRYYSKSVFLRNLSNIYFSMAKSSQNDMKRFINSLPPKYLYQVNLNQMLQCNHKQSIILLNPSTQKVIDKSEHLNKKYNILVILTDNFNPGLRINFPVLHISKASDVKLHSFNIFRRTIVDKLPSIQFFNILQSTYNVSYVKDKPAFNSISKNSVSIVIPTYKPNHLLFDNINMLNAQKHIGELEIIIVDSGSDNATLRKLKSLENVKLFTIQHEKFSHSFSRNYGASKARYANVVMMTQDAIPNNKIWLQHLINPLVTNKAVASTCCEACPPTTDPYYKSLSDYHTHFIDYGKNKIRNYWYGYLRKVSNLNDVACAYKNEILEKYPLNLDYAEDLDLGIRLILNNYNLAFLKHCKVFHGHNRDARYYFERSVVDSKIINTFFSTKFIEKDNKILNYYLYCVLNNYSFINDWLSNISKDKNIIDCETFLKYSKLSFDELIMSRKPSFSKKINVFEDKTIHKFIVYYSNNKAVKSSANNDYSIAYAVRSFIYENTIKFIDNKTIFFSKSLVIKLLYKRMVAAIGGTLGVFYDYPTLKKEINKFFKLEV